MAFLHGGVLAQMGEALHDFATVGLGRHTGVPLSGAVCREVEQSGNDLDVGIDAGLEHYSVVSSYAAASAPNPPTRWAILSKPTARI